MAAQIQLKLLQHQSKQAVKEKNQQNNIKESIYSQPQTLTSVVQMWSRVLAVFRQGNGVHLHKVVHSAHQTHLREAVDDLIPILRNSVRHFDVLKGIGEADAERVKDTLWRHFPRQL